MGPEATLPFEAAQRSDDAPILSTRRPIEYRRRCESRTRSTGRACWTRGVRTWQSLEVIQHEVDDHAGHRYIEPERECPHRDSDVPVELAAKPAESRQQRQRHDRRGERDVGGENCEVDHPHRTCPWKGLRTRLRVVDHVADEKGG